MEASYCYMAAEVAGCNDIKVESMDTNSGDSNSNGIINDDGSNMTLNTTTNINDLKKNLYTEEEEFRSINHTEPIHIFLKIKPLSEQELHQQNDQLLYKIHSDTTLSLKPPKNSSYCQNKAAKDTLSNTKFQFSYVFQPTIKQKDFFMATIYPCFEKFFNGDNLLIFSYGVTNSGKTYTMQGTSLNPGLIPRTLDFLFDSLKDNLEMKRSIYAFKPDKFNEICSLNDTELTQELAYKEQLLRLSNYKELERVDSMSSLVDIADSNCSLENSKKFGGSLDSLSKIANSEGFTSGLCNFTKSELTSNIRIPANKKYTIWISFYELYNDAVYDLLTIPNKNVRTTILNERPQLKIREDSNRIPYVEGLVQIPVFSTNEAIKVLKYGEKNLQKSSNSINSASSRSHAVFCMKIVSKETSSIHGGSSMISINQLSFCDLAGIERLSKTNAIGKVQKEASNINNSLLALSRCINQMIANQKMKSNTGQIPYRDNKLTRLFQAYFEGRSMVKMIVNLNPSLTFFDESVNVLKFAAIANQIQIGLNDEDKIQYRIEAETPTNNRLTVGWEMDSTRKCDETTYNQEEYTEEEEETEEEEQETEEEVTQEGEDEEEESEEDDDEEESEEDDEDEEETEEEDETEEEVTIEESNNEDLKENKSVKKKSLSKSITKSINDNKAIKKPTPKKSTLHKSANSTRMNQTGATEQTIDEEDETEIEETVDETVDETVESGESVEMEEETEEEVTQEGEEEEEETEEEETEEDETEEEEKDEEGEDEEEEDEEDTEEEEDEEEEGTEIEETMNSEAGTSLNATTNETTDVTAKSKLVELKEKTMLNEINKTKKRNSKTPKSLIKNDKSLINKTASSTKKTKSKSIGSAKNPEGSKLLNKTKEKGQQNMNKTVNRVRESNINTTEVKNIIYEKMSKEHLIRRIHELNEKIEQSEKERVKFESELRHELVSKWSKRVETAEANHQTELEQRCNQVEQLWIKKMKMVEELYQSKYDKKRDEIEKNMENITKQLKQSELDLKKAQEEIEMLKMQLAEATEKINESSIMPSMLSSTKAPQTVKQERMSQSAFDTHLRLENDDDDNEKTQPNQSKLINETTGNEKTFNGDSSRSNPNKRKLDYNEFKQEYEEEMEFDDYDLNISKNKRQHLLINHSIQTEDVRNRSVGLEVTLDYNEINSLKKDVDFKAQQCELLNGKLTEKLNLIKELEEELELVNKTNDKFQTELKTKLDDLNQQLAESKSKEAELKKQLNEAEKNLSLYSDKNDKLNLEIKKLNSDLDESSKVTEKFTSKLAQFEKEKKTHLDKISSNENLIKELEEQIAKANTQLADRTSVVARLENTLDQLNKELMKAKGDNENLRNELQFNVNQIDKINHEFEKQRLQIVELNKEKQSNIEMINTLRTEKDTIASQNKLITSTNQSLTSQLKEMQTEKEASVIAVLATSKNKKETKEKPPKPEKDKEKIEPMVVDEEIVQEEPLVSVDKVKRTKSTSSLKKSSRSTSKLSTASSIDEAVVAVAAVATSTVADSESESKKSLRPQSSRSKLKKKPTIEEEPMEEINEKLEKKNKVDDSIITIDSTIEVNSKFKDDKSISHPPVPNVTRKKSTFNRITEMITKSPILEPLRNRPTRATKLKSSASNASDFASTSPTAASKTLEKKPKSKQTNITDTLKKIDDENAENLNPEEETKVKKTTRKKKVF